MQNALAHLHEAQSSASGRSDALYHNFEHTLLVTRVGRDILQGLALSQRIEPDDYTHLIVACLLHDIGYVRGILSGDSKAEFVVDGSGRRVAIPRGASDAALAPYHVDRSKLFAFERLGNSPIIDAERVSRAIEFTRFPSTQDATSDNLESRLVQAGRPDWATWRSAVFTQGECAVF